MTLDTLIMLSGALVALLPFLGFPPDMRSILFLILGIFILALGIAVRRKGDKLYRAPVRAQEAPAAAQEAKD